MNKSVSAAFPEKHKLIILSIDGFPAYYLDHPEVMDEIPNLKNLFAISQGGRIQTINPSLTYASHTSMITGKDPGIHGIEGNTPIDPFDQEDGAWLWYYDDIQVNTLFDIAYQHKMKVANVYWPVTVGAPIQWNIPQFWREKTKSDLKILRSLSTPHLHRSMERKIGIPVLETTKDDTKIRTGIELFVRYNPDITFIYSTDVDTYHHAKGPFSKQAIEKLKLTDKYVGELIQRTHLYERKDLALIVVSDHGFATADSICRPNQFLREIEEIKPKEKIWFHYVKSSGGFAYLLSNSDPYELNNQSQIDKTSSQSTTRLNSNEILKLLGQKITVECPKIRIISSGNEFELLKKESHPNAIAFFLADGSTHISTSLSGGFFSEVENPIFTHGFPAYQNEMDTIGFFYSKKRSEAKNSIQSKNEIYPKMGNVKKTKSTLDKKEIQFQSVKDVFKLSCEWMKWNCKTEKQKKD